MLVNKDVIRFESADNRFLEKYGFFRASTMVREHSERYTTPFVNDTDQLARALGLRLRHLFYLLRNIDKQYERKEVPKKSGGTRVLYTPSFLLKQTQYFLLHNFLDKMPVSPHATAYQKGKRLTDNAGVHVGHTYLLKMDITDFFDSITFVQVRGALFPKDMYPSHIQTMLTALCCRNDTLPQGAPTSPAVSNLVMRRFDDRLGAWCEKHDIAYTRYCDDLTFSANVPLFAVYQKATAMLTEMGFTVNEKKTRFIKNTSRQMVTGLTVNEKLSVNAEYKRALRQELYYVLQYGLADSIVYGKKADFLTNGKPDFHRYYHHLRGKLNFLLMADPQNEWFQKAKKQLDVKYHWEINEEERYSRPRNARGVYF